MTLGIRVSRLCLNLINPMIIISSLPLLLVISLPQFKANCELKIGAVHKVRHAIFGQFLPPPPVTLCHPSRYKNRTKANCTNSLSIVRGGFCPGGFVRGSFVWKILSEVVFVHSPFCQNTCYNRKLNITLNFMFHMYDKKCISVTSHALYPSPSVTNCHTFSDPLERDVFYGRPHRH